MVGGVSLIAVGAVGAAADAAGAPATVKTANARHARFSFSMLLKDSMESPAGYVTLKGRRGDKIVFLAAATAALKFHGYFTLGAMFVKTDLPPGTAVYHNARAEGNVKYHTPPANGIFLRVSIQRVEARKHSNYIQSLVSHLLTRSARRLACGFRSIGGINVVRQFAPVP